MMESRLLAQPRSRMINYIGTGPPLRRTQQINNRSDPNIQSALQEHSERVARQQSNERYELNNPGGIRGGKRRVKRTRRRKGTQRR
jgi:hypothetical protein